MSLLVDIEKKLGSFQLKVCWESGDGVLALLGASGCGKSMTLRCIAGIETPDRGRIVLDGVTLFDSEKKINLPPQQRHVGYLFQQYALFPNMTVEQNIRCGAGGRKAAPDSVSAIIRAMHLEGTEQLKPFQLSGGQQQRAALARILITEPNLLLLDEPFSALDSHLRFRLEQEVRSVIHRFGKPVVLVSHDRDEVFRLSDRIAVMNNGHLDTIGPKAEVFANPKTRAAAVLTGCKNISPMTRLSSHSFRADAWGVTLGLPGDVPDAAYVGIRLHDVTPSDEPEGILCRVTDVVENPFSHTLLLCPEGCTDGVGFGCELNKPLWQKLRADTLRVSLPVSSLIFLKE